MIEVRPWVRKPSPVWVVVYEDSVIVATIEQAGAHAYVVASYPHRRFWTCLPTLAGAARWCQESAEDVMDGGVLDNEEALVGRFDGSL